MGLAYAFLANSAEYAGDGKLLVVGGDITELQVETSSSPPSLSLVVKLEFTAEECGREYRFGVQLVAPGGQVLEAQELTLTPPLPERSDRTMGAGMVFGFSELSFPAPGQYGFRLSLDGRELKTVVLHVEHAPTVAASPASLGG